MKSLRNYSAFLEIVVNEDIEYKKINEKISMIESSE